MELDMHIAIEINDKIAEATEQAKRSTTSSSGLKRLSPSDAQGVIARRDARRKQDKQKDNA